MKAIRIHAFGGPESLVYEDISEPQLKAGEILVQTHTVGVNPIDWKTCSGGGAAPFIGDLPFVPGWEFSGHVIACGSDVSGFTSDDAIFGFIRFPAAADCYAEQIAVPAEQISLVPTSVDLKLAGGLALAGLTAWQALFDKGALKPQQKVLIIAAAGGVGHLAVQLAKWKGAHVTGTASSSNHDFLTSLGCDEVLDYHQADNLSGDRRFDLIIDGVGGDTGINAVESLAEGGCLVTLPSVTKDAVIAAGQAKGKQVLPIRVEPNAHQLSILASLVAEGELNMHLATSYSLSEAAQAFKDIASGHTRGKVVLTVSQQTL